MVSARIQNGFLTLEVLGWHKLWAMKSRLRIPLSRIVNASVGVTSDARLSFGDIKAPGTAVPGKFYAGTFWRSGKRMFWDVRVDRHNAITLETQGERYALVVVDVRNSQQLAQAIEEAQGDPIQPPRYLS